MSCPFSEFELEMFDGVCNPMGQPCNDCEDYECEHNNNDNNPEWLFDGSGDPMTVEEFAEKNNLPSVGGGKGGGPGDCREKTGGNKE